MTPIDTSLCLAKVFCSNSGELSVIMDYLGGSMEIRGPLKAAEEVDLKSSHHMKKNFFVTTYDDGR